MRAALLIVVALAACKRDEDPTETKQPERPSAKSKSKATQTSPPATATATATDPAAPRYLRANAQGALVDAFQFPSVPAFIVEQEVAAASSKSDAAGILRRFGLSSLKGQSGHVWMARASLVDRLARERILVVSFASDPGDDGLRDEDGWVVFLGSTSDDRVLKIGNARFTAKTLDGAPVEVDAHELHSKDADDVVASFSSCTKPMQKACHTMRAWTMLRGYPELILDVTGDNKPTIAGAAPPHDVIVDKRVLKFDPEKFAYR